MLTEGAANELCVGSNAAFANKFNGMILSVKFNKEPMSVQEMLHEVTTTCAGTCSICDKLVPTCYTTCGISFFGTGTACTACVAPC